ncbi:hypothetical protein ZWY2020_058550 [Hordeum vulgare]|nr:hypothetical protein ZWY2020_058550 [Hordeum vulgare]
MRLYPERSHGRSLEPPCLQLHVGLQRLKSLWPPPDLDQREHLDIRKGKSLEEAINYEDFKSMAFTRAVIFDTLRLATVVNGLLRKTTQEVEMNSEICLEINPTTNLEFSRKMLS